LVAAVGGRSVLSDEKRLIKRLLANYKRVGVIGRPVDNTSQTVSVSYGMSLIQILDVDERNQVLTINIWSRYVGVILLLFRSSIVDVGVHHGILPLRGGMTGQSAPVVFAFWSL